MDTHYEAINWAMGEVSWFQRATGEAAERLRNKAREQTAGFHAWLERQLGERDWFNGAHFGWGDLSVVPYVAGSVGNGFPPPKGSRLSEWLSRTVARPSVAQTMAESQSFDRGGSNIAEAVAAGLFKREYRDHRLEWMIKSGGVDIVLKGLEAGNIRFAPDFN
jgi:glutathione S-transferase/RNA polymerase-associated protein